MNTTDNICPKHGMSYLLRRNAETGKVALACPGTTIPFTNVLSYALDQEGRAGGLWDNTISQSIWWSSVPVYNPAGQPNNVHFYSGDSESFNWDQTTGHMNSWSSYVGSLQQIGNLTWNAMAPHRSCRSMIRPIPAILRPALTPTTM
jgi:hypothetical protein